MLAGTAAFVLGAWLLHRQPGLPDVALLQALPVCLLLVFASRRWRPAAAGGCGFLWALLHASAVAPGPLPAALEGVDLDLEGRVRGVPVARAGRVRFELRIERAARADEPGAALNALHGRVVRLSWYRAAGTVRAGERWRARARLKQATSLMNPGGFDYAGWLYQRGISATGYVPGPGAAARLAAARWWSLDALRQRIGESIAVALAGRAEAGLVEALVVGLRDDVTSTQWRVLRETGTSHLMAISGLHVGLIAGLAMVVVRLAWSRSERLTLALPATRAGLGASALAALSYAALAGFSIPTQRALVMVAVAVSARLLARRIGVSNGLALAALVVVVADPVAPVSAGFWLSFCAVAMLMLGAGARLGQARGTQTLRARCWRWARVYWIASLGTAPLVLFLFSGQSLLAPVANAIAVPWVGMLVVPAALCGGALVGVWPAGGEPLLALAAQALAVLWPLLELIATAPVRLSTPGGPSAAALVLGLFAVGLLVLPVRPALRLWGVVWLAPLLLDPAPAPPPGGLWLDVLDVGQGLAVVVRTRRHVLVYDTGPRFGPGFDAARAAVLPFLRDAGVDTLDMLMISHGDDDHIGGARSVLAEVPVAETVSDWEIGEHPRGPCVAGRRWRWDGVNFEILHPYEPRPRSDNDRSCVLRIDGAGGSVLLAGDIERRGEQAVAARLAARPPVDVLVVSHHGSATSSGETFLNAARPRHGAISTGRRNRFGMPHDDALARLRRHGVVLRSTVSCGAIAYRLEPSAAPAPPRCWREVVRRHWHAPAGGPVPPGEGAVTW